MWVIIMRTKISGVYKIQSKFVPNRLYVGSSLDIHKRWWDHKTRLKEGLHKNPILQAHYNKYGTDDFEFCVIEECSQEMLINREQYYIDVLRPSFNVLLFAENSLGHKHSEETKQKIREKAIGRIVSDETKQRMSDSQLKANRGGINHPMYGKHHKESSRIKSSESHMGIPSWNKGLTKETDERVMKIYLKLKGRKLSEQNKINIGISSKKAWLRRKETVIC